MIVLGMMTMRSAITAILVFLLMYATNPFEAAFIYWGLGLLPLQLILVAWADLTHGRVYSTPLRGI